MAIAPNADSRRGCHPRIAGLVLAAGAARRFASPKQLARFGGRPLLEHALVAATTAAGVGRVVVTLGAYAEEIASAVDLHGASPLRVPDWEEGQAASLRAGVRALAGDADAVVVLLGDHPRVTAATVEHVVSAWDDDVDAVRATFAGVPGHPVVLGRSLYAAIAALRGDVGARELLARAVVREVACGREAVLDVDVPAQLRAEDDTRRERRSAPSAG